MKKEQKHIKAIYDSAPSFYKILETKNVGSQTHKLVRFNLPRMPRSRRIQILDKTLEESGASALVEIF
jgi:hypothetical protein